MVEKKVLHLSFTNDTGKVASITIPNPKEGLTLAQVSQTGETIAKQGVLDGTIGVFTVFKGAHIVTTISEELA